MRYCIARGLPLLLSTALTAALGAQAPASTQEPANRPPQKPEEQPPRFRSEANFVRVDVYPTAAGRPVQDLRKEDFELLEDGVPQAVDTFEFVQVRPAGPQSTRVEADSRQAAEQMAANPRNRVFIIFLDVPHVSIVGAHAINEPLIRLLDRVLGPDDLVGVMTTSMAATQMTLGRKTEVLARGLRENWPWGERSRIIPMDQREQLYEECYERYDNGPLLVRKMKDRRRERMTFEALEDLVRYLQSIRDERKAIITISEGWALYRPDPEMMELRYNIVRGQKIYEEMPGTEHIGVGPGGKLTTKDWNKPIAGSKYGCDTERRQLSDINNEEFFRDLLHTANRANVSFYPVDPRGLPAFDSEIGPEVPPPPAVDHAQLRGRISSLRTLAENTDGLAVVDSNALDQGLRRIADDLTSYYLLGYYSSNAKLDGRFRQIKVQVKRPGVSVRARRGYRAATADEVAAARSAAAAPVPENTAALTAAFGTLSRARADAKLIVNASAMPGGSIVWVSGELPPSAGENPWAGGATAEVNAGAGTQSATARVTIAPGERAFVTSVPLPVGEQAHVDVRVRVSPTAGSAPAAIDIVRVDVAPGLAQPLIFRRGPTTANRWRPAADFRFSRTERMRLEVAIASTVKPGVGRLLDKAGKSLEVPVTVAERTDDATGQRWLTAEIVLAPLAPGDYAIELGATAAAGEQKVVTAVRVTR